MFRRAIRFGSMVLLAMPALAIAVTPDADPAEAWTATETSLRANGAGISLPMTVAGLSLSKSGEASNGGKGIDNVAQYLSDDGAIQATLYIYRPGYADAAIAAHMTDRAVMERFGSRTRRTAFGSAAVSGHEGAAIRAVYDDAADGALTTAAAFVQSGAWMVKLRVTGPTDQRKAVLDGFDGMIAALRVENSASLASSATATIAPCAVVSAAALYCLRGSVAAADGNYDLIQRGDNAVIVPIDDTGTTLSFDRASPSTPYAVSMHAIDGTRSLGRVKALPEGVDIAAIIDGNDPRVDGAWSGAAKAAQAR